MTDLEMKQEILAALKPHDGEYWNYRVFTKEWSVFVADKLDLMPAEDVDTNDKVEGPYVLAQGKQVAVLGILDPDFRSQPVDIYMIPWSSIDHSRQFKLTVGCQIFPEGGGNE